MQTVKLVLRNQFEIANKEEDITIQDMNRAKILADILQTISTINEYYSHAKTLHKSPMQMALDVDYFGVRPSASNTRKVRELTDEELKEQERQELEDLKRYEEEEIRERVQILADIKEQEELERKLMREKGLLPPEQGNGSALESRKTRNQEAIF